MIEHTAAESDLLLSDIHEVVFGYTDAWGMSDREISLKCKVPQGVVEDARAMDEQSLLLIFYRLSISTPDSYFSVKLKLSWQIPKSAT